MNVKNIVKKIKEEIEKNNKYIDDKLILAREDKLSLLNDTNTETLVKVNVYGFLSNGHMKLQELEIKSEDDLDYESFSSKIVFDALVFNWVEIFVEGKYDQNVYLIQVFKEDLFW